MSETSLDEAKRAARRAARAGRTEAAAAASGGGAGAAGALVERFFESYEPAAGLVVSGYLPIRDELDPRPLLAALEARGLRVCLPVVIAAGEPLAFRAWSPGEPLVENAFGTQAPPETAEVLEPDWFLVPLLAFDRAGRRLGYGGGFYDRTLAAARAKREVRAIGLAYAGQEVESVPADERDQRLDWILTERGTIRVADGVTGEAV